MAFWPWRNRDGQHVSPEVERSSAELVGKLEMLCQELEKLITFEEQQIEDEGDE